jgi:hypothetical protein
MLGLIRHITFPSQLLIAFWFSTVPLFAQRLSWHLLPGTLLQLLTRLNLIEFKENSKLYVTPDVLMA